MNQNQWQRIESLFHECLALEPEAREQYLKTKTADEPALFSEVKSLLDAEHETGVEFEILPLESRDAYLPGERVSFNVTSSENGYVRCYMDTLLGILQIFPNPFTEKSFLISSDKINLPDSVEYAILAERHGESILCLMTPDEVNHLLPGFLQVGAFKSLSVSSLSEILDTYANLPTKWLAASTFVIPVEAIQ